jgi:saccharopine dehydrogenase (NAD+, L-lysine-forming)
MNGHIGIRREDKNEWERRVPLIPTDVGVLKRRHGVDVSLQPFPTRAFRDAEYIGVGAKIDEALESCNVVLGIKEMPIDFFKPDVTYMFFAHVIKGQPYNMPMLRKILDTGSNLIDYEKITDDHARRLVFFGSEAGQAGMIDTLWALGQRLDEEGIENPFTGIRKATEYSRLTAAEVAIEDVGRLIEDNGVPEEIHPIIFGFAGYGNVSLGAQGVLSYMPVIEITPAELLDPPPDLFDSRNHVYKVEFREEDMVDPVDPAQPFVLQDYYDHPEKYRGVFPKYVPHLTVLLNCIFWTPKYPRLVTKELIHSLYKDGNAKLKVIGDISVDVEGAVEVTVKTTDPGSPVFVYDVDSGKAVDGVKGNGPVILAVDNLPAELPRESSTRFSETLTPFIPNLAKADFSRELDMLDLDPPMKRALICYHGNLTPDYEYLHEHLNT